MTTFVLVHGAWHGGWCWDRLVPELASRGHHSIVMDLPLEDGTATFADYAGVVVEAAASAPDDCVLVGHSLGGMVVPLVAARRPAAAMFFVNAVVPNPSGMPWDDLPEMGPDYGAVRAEDGTLTFESDEPAIAVFYQDCTPEDASWAARQLRPFNNSSLWDRPYPLAELPDVPAYAATCRDDRAMLPEYQRAALRARIGIDPIELPGGHSPFLSRPATLADTLVSTA